MLDNMITRCLTRKMTVFKWIYAFTMNVVPGTYKVGECKSGKPANLRNEFEMNPNYPLANLL